ncbi:hypothetical protein ACFXPI_27200 [Streptomyces sp. NPDC059104]|uniref:hypothetical protein n=1 Tax=Streptomyces sp. NPDC059104 TaxID=3346729 RepID=UPI00367A2972
MDGPAQDDLSAQRAFLDARLADLLATGGHRTLMPAVHALAASVRGLAEEADRARSRGDRAVYATAARQLHAVARQWADHPDYRSPGPLPLPHESQD